MHSKRELEEALIKKAARKARPGGPPKWRNLPRNWAHQAISYMDAGELSTRVFFEVVEIILVIMLISTGLPELGVGWTAVIAFFAVHTWNWVTNGLFWNVVITTFPNLRNPGAAATVEYLNTMRTRLLRYPCITGLLIYGSVTRGSWHDRSDIDIRILRAPGVINLLVAVLLTMRERFNAFLAKQPMDLYLADGVDFLMKMREDEKPVLLINRDPKLFEFYPDSQERPIAIADLIGT